MEMQRGREKWPERLTRIVNSTVCFSLAYILITYSYWLAMGFAGLLFRFDSFVYYYWIKFILNDRDWTKLKITAIFSSGPLICFGLGLLCFFLFERLKNLKSIVNLFLLWVFVIGTSLFTSQAMIAALGANKYASPFYQGLAVVYAWWHLPNAVVYLLALPFIFLFLFFSVNYAKPFLTTAFSYSKVNTESRRKMYFLEMVIVPFILGAGITTGVTFPMNIKVHGLNMAMLGMSLVIGWVSLRYNKVSKEEMLKYPSLQVLNPVFMFLLSLAIFFVFIGWKGINLHLH
jgi:hypothetical protein